ncbi:protein-L-isoaspartate O-methyltransferase family protein [Mesorhizobium sp. ES1-4]|uniref:protein-L-isoaspartate O-methyltransferase family protein n=1 Tax=Mesorhizobium sp. ES1-4 TaxID=2876627 RepID=UPI001CCD38AF|nr:protein-L-isoaspartate O-methyltransferase [Mesorhizobium sp. ES1-4]MBZ9799177.1 protein-L-isoaspartate O-methyltransferase [Mesorhizobium sp. ES1-4]
MKRRDFLALSAGAAASSILPAAVRADVPVPYDRNAEVPFKDKKSFIDWMVANRREDPKLLAERFDRFQIMVYNKDVLDDRNKRAFLLTPREEFVLPQNLGRAYDHAFLDIGYGVTISGPHLVGRMTTSIDVQFGESVLEIGTGSGYQSAYLANLTDKVHTIEIINPLAQRTRRTYDGLIGRGYSEFGSVTSRNADGYYGWESVGPFDKIIVTCGIDHIPPSLLQQLKPNGVMVIPVGPPGAQHVLKVIKQQLADGTFNIVRSDIYNGKVVPFVPFTKLEGDQIVGTHNG